MSAFSVESCAGKPLRLRLALAHGRPSGMQSRVDMSGGRKSGQVARRVKRNWPKRPVVELAMMRPRLVVLPGAHGESTAHWRPP